MITLNLREILGAKGSIEKIIKQDIDIVQSFKLAKLIKMLNENINEFYDQRNALIKKYGEKSGEDSYEIKDEENRNKVEEELKKLLDHSIEINFELMSLEDLKGVQISTENALTLEKFFKQ